MIGSIVVGGMLTCALLHSMCDIKAAQRKVQHSLIWVHMQITYNHSPVNSSINFKLKLKPKHFSGNLKGSEENYIDKTHLYYSIKHA